MYLHLLLHLLLHLQRESSIVWVRGALHPVHVQVWGCRCKRETAGAGVAHTLGVQVQECGM